MSADTASQGTVWVLRYSHKHGDDILAFTSFELAHAALASIAREWWDDIAGWAGEGWARGDVPETPEGLDDETVIEVYFDHQDDESYSIELIAVLGDADDVAQLTGKE